MQIVAGAGTGKTLALTLKCLWAVYVEGKDPESIIATTFTNKAARELHSRILEKGEELVEVVAKTMTTADAQKLRYIDLNAIRYGTLDSIIQEALSGERRSGSPPLPIEPFVARSLLIREGLFVEGRHLNKDLESFLQKFLCRRYPPFLSLKDKADILYSIRDFVRTSGVDVERYLENTKEPGARIAFDAITCFEQSLAERNSYCLQQRLGRP